MEENRKGIFIKVLVVFVLLILCRFFLKQIIFAFVPQTPFMNVIISAVIVIFLAVVVALIAKR